MAAFGEKWLGAGRDVDNMAMITLGTGIGGAIILNGKIFYGMNGMAGEFGHVTIEPNGVPCGCGNHGCAERYASATAVVRMAREAIESGKAPALAKAASSDAEFSARSLYNLAIQGNEDAQRIFRSLRPWSWDPARRSDQRSESRHVRDRRRRRQRLGRFRAHRCSPSCAIAHLVYAATAPEDSSAKKEGASAQIAAYTRKKTIITRALLGSDAGLYGAARIPLS